MAHIDLTNKQHFSRTWILAYPVMLSQVGHMLTGIADSIMVGHLGAVPLAAASLANSVFSIILVFGLGMSFGLTPLVASADGSNHTSRVRELLDNGIVFNMATALALFVILYLLSPVFYYLEQPADAVELAIPYFNIVLFSLVPLMFYQSYKQFAEGLSNTRVAMIISLGGNILNIGMNYVLIYGKLGFPALGLNGAGIATLAARCLMAVAMCVYVYKSKSMKSHVQTFSFARISRKLMKKLSNLGVPIGLQFTLEVAAFAFAAIMVGWLGAQQLAAHQIALSLAATTYMMASGISAAVTVRVGNALGRRDSIGVKNSANAAYLMVLIFMGICAVLLIAFHNVLPTFFIKDPLVQEVAAMLIVIAAVFQLSDGLQVVCLGALRGLHDVKLPTYITVVAYWMIGLPFGYVMGVQLGYGANGIWYGLLLGLSCAAVMLYFRFRHVSRQYALSLHN